MTLPMTLTLATDNFDQLHTFAVEIAGRRGAKRLKCALHRDYQRKGDSIYWGLQVSAVLKDRYTAIDVAERERIATQTPVRNGDVVMIDGRNYTARVLGDYSNAVVFDEVAQ